VCWVQLKARCRSCLRVQNLRRTRSLVGHRARRRQALGVSHDMASGSRASVDFSAPHAGDLSWLWRWWLRSLRGVRNHDPQVLASVATGALLGLLQRSCSLRRGPDLQTDEATALATVAGAGVLIPGDGIKGSSRSRCAGAPKLHTRPLRPRSSDRQAANVSGMGRDSNIHLRPHAVMVRCLKAMLFSPVMLSNDSYLRGE
jgi:hypothetical protein